MHFNFTFSRGISLMKLYGKWKVILIFVEICKYLNAKLP